jgi:uncharacterized tellurite resistance protein B-like protein
VSQSERILYALALLYLVCSHATDGKLGQSEVDAVTERIARWMPDAAPKDVHRVLAKALELYQSIGDEADRRRQAHACATIVKRDIDPEHLPEVVADLHAIVEADGLVSEGEDELMAAVLETFGMPLPPQDP